MSDSLARRDWHVEARARRYRALGLPVPAETLQRQAAEDLRLLDSARAAGALRVKSGVKSPAPARKRQDPAQRDAAAIGASVRVRDLPAADAPRALPPLRGVDAQRTHAMAARLRLIGLRTDERIRAGADMESGFQYARLAKAAADAVFNYGARRGPYAGKSDHDRNRILIRQLEDVCDQSNPVIGFGWWLK